MNKNIIFYPAVFTPEEIGFSVVVPDIEGCFSEGDSLSEACLYVKDAIGLCLEDMEEFPAPSNPQSIELKENEFLVLIEFDMVKYKQRTSKRAVKKTLSIPAWLNEEAERRHVNFSGVLSAALKNHLNL